MQIVKRVIEIEAMITEPGFLKISATLKDTYHTIEMLMTVDDVEFRILDITAEMIDAANSKCAGAADSIQGLVGLQLGKGFNRQVLEVIGDVKGCTHLTNLVMQVNAMKPITHPMLRGEDESYREPWRERPPSFSHNNNPELMGVCYAFTED